MRCPTLLLLVLLLSASLPSQPSPCPGSGPTLGLGGGRLGDAWSLTLSGPPNASGYLGFDLSEGPVASPFGPICLGFSPALTVLPVTLDPLGAVSFGGVLPPDTGLAGVSLFIQALVSDAGAVLGASLSNGAGALIHPPRWFLLDPGLSTPFGSTPGTLASFDALSDVGGFVTPLPSVALDLVRIPLYRAVVVLLQGGVLLGVDETTGSILLNAALPPGPGSPSRLAVTEDGGGLVVLYGGTPPSPFGGGTPGALRFVSVPSAAVLTTVNLQSGNPSDLLLVPGTGVAYLRDGATLIPLDYISGTQLPSISLGSANGGVVDWRLEGNLLLTLLGGVLPNPFGGTGSPAALHAVDVSIHQTVLGGPVVLGGMGATRLRTGPGSMGPALFVLFPTQGSLLELAPGIFTTLSSIPVPAGTGFLELSAGGTQWALMQSGSAGPIGTPQPGSLLALDPLTLAITPLQTLPSEIQQHLLVVPSGTLRKAYVISGNGTLLPFATDPLAAAGPGLSLPITSAGFRVLPDRP